MTAEQAIQKAIKRLTDLELSSKIGQEECFNIRRELERVYAPAPKRGKTQALSAAASAKLIHDFRKNREKQKQAKKTG